MKKKDKKKGKTKKEAKISEKEFSRLVAETLETHSLETLDKMWKDCEFFQNKINELKSLELQARTIGLTPKIALEIGEAEIHVVGLKQKLLQGKGAVKEDIIISNAIKKFRKEHGDKSDKLKTKRNKDIDRVVEKYNPQILTAIKKHIELINEAHEIIERMKKRGKKEAS